MPKRRLLVLLLIGMALALVATGCEFPGPAVTVTFTSPADGQHIQGSRTITVTGEYTAPAPSAVKLTVNGTPVNVTVSPSGTFSAQVDLSDCSNKLEAQATTSVATSAATLQLVYEPSYPALCFLDGQDATYVIGQYNFSASLGKVGQAYLDGPAGAPALVGGHLYVPDTANNRVVGLATIPSQNGANFSILLGQADYFANAASATTTGSTLTAPSAVTDAGGNLATVDTGHNRVLLYSGAPTSNVAAVVAVGQTSLFTSTNVACDAVHIDGPTSAVVTPGGKLIVADTKHNRVLIWNTVPTQSGVAANLVLGQTGFGTCGANAGGRTAATLAGPTDVWSDGTRLVVVDTDNNRVLVWTSFPTVSGQAASLVLGQSGMTSATSNAGPSGLSKPSSVASFGKQLFVADAGNNRVLIWNDFPTADGEAANAVLGQADFTSTFSNRGGITGAGTLSNPQGVRAVNGTLMVADTGNARELIYRP